MTGKIDPRDVSFVLQGKNVKGQTSLCCQSIRKHFPGAEIIFSTYIGEDVSDLDFDVLVESSDPGAEKFNGGYNQTNRILVTSKAGLSHVKTPYCVRMRGDLIFKNNNILQYNTLKKRSCDFSVFEQRVLIFQLWTRLSYKSLNYEYTPLYFSDWFCFGKTNDIVNFYTASPLTEEPAFTNWFLEEKNRHNFGYICTVYRKFDPEQYMGNNFFKERFPSINMKDLTDYSKEKMELSNKILANNYIVGGFKECGFIINKRPYAKLVKKDEFPKTSDHLNGICTHKKFLEIYKKYCDPDFIIPFKYRWKQDLKIQKYYEHYKKHSSRLAAPAKAFLRWLNDLLATPYYASRILLNILWYAPRTVYHETPIKKITNETENER